MPLERHQREILITTITMPHRLGLLGIHMLLHHREGLLLIRTLLTRMQHRQPGGTLRLLLPVRLPEIRIMMILIMPRARTQHLHLPGQLLKQILTQLILTREHLQPQRLIHMQRLLEQTHMLAPTRMEDPRHLQHMLPILELLPKIPMLRILMLEIRTRDQLQTRMLQIRMRGRPLQHQLPPRSVTRMQDLLHPQQIPMLELPLLILMPVPLHLIHMLDQLLQIHTLRFKLRAVVSLSFIFSIFCQGASRNLNSHSILMCVLIQ